MAQPAGIPGSTLTGPWPVGHYAAALRERLRGFARVQVFGEVFGFKAGRAKVWFELRDAGGALPCSMWREDFESLKIGPLADGAQVVAAGGCDYYAGSRTASPGFSFAVTALRVAGEGDLLAQLAQLRRRLDEEGLFAPQKALPRPALPRCIGVVTGESGKARDDVLAGLRRRGWGGRVVWGFAPVQDRHAAPAVTRALQDLAACPEVEVIVVARGGGSLADLFAFCDETLCRTVALLRVPVIASVGHHTDRTLHRRRRRRLLLHAHARRRGRRAGRLRRPPARPRPRRRALGAPGPPRGARPRPRARPAVPRARPPPRPPPRPPAPAAARAARRHPPRAGRRPARHRGRRDRARRAARVPPARRASGRARTPARRRPRSSRASVERRRRELERLLATLAAHDPQRTLERGYALVEDAAGEPVTSAAAARAQPRLSVRLHDGRVAVRPEPAQP